MQDIFIFTLRQCNDTELAELLWVNPKVTKYICASGRFNIYDIANRLNTEILFEKGFHLRPEFLGKGYAKEAANAAIDHAFTTLKARKLFAGRNPNSTVSRKLMRKLGFSYIRDELYEPTGLYHPSYELKSSSWA